MKVTDYIIRFLEEKGVTDIFGYPGGMITHFMDSASKSQKLSSHCCYHEQAAAFAACSYAQASGRLGVAFSTCGPGALNLVTGIANAYYDSIPTLFITGQVDTFAVKGESGVRQKGFQETDFVSVTKSISKYSAFIDSPEKVEECVEKAYFLAVSGRPGPVVLDIPADIQRAEIQVTGNYNTPCYSLQEEDIEETSKKIEGFLRGAKRPVILGGAGLKQAHMTEEFKSLTSQWRIPVISSMAAVDILPYKHPLNMGFTGINGQRYSNFILAKSDLIITMGARMDEHQVGGNRKNYATNARLLRIDIDTNELGYAVREDEIPISADLTRLLPGLKKIQYKTGDEWLHVCEKIKNALFLMDKENQHKIITELSEKIPADYNVTIDVGQSMVWSAQSYHLKENQRMYMSAGLGSMGYSLPAAIGVYYATHRPVVCINGDGGIQMNIQELQFIYREKLPIKIVVLNNHSLGMIRQFQEKIFEKNYVQTVSTNGYLPVNFEKTAAVYGFSYYHVTRIQDISGIDFESNVPAMIEVSLPEITYLNPSLKKSNQIQEQIPYIDGKLSEELMGL